MLATTNWNLEVAITIFDMIKDDDWLKSLFKDDDDCNENTTGMLVHYVNLFKTISS